LGNHLELGLRLGLVFNNFESKIKHCLNVQSKNWQTVRSSGACQITPSSLILNFNAFGVVTIFLFSFFPIVIKITMRLFKFLGRSVPIADKIAKAKKQKQQTKLLG